MTAGPADGVGGFPPTLTSLIGRDGEVARLTQWLESHRLVTVTGPGGVGKTRVAAEVSHRLATASGAQVWVVELAAVDDPEQVPAAVAACLGCRQRPGWSVVQSINTLLASEPGVLVLDNCEHVVDAVAGLCTRLLAGGDEVRILATSREPVGVPGEARLRLSPLAAEGRTATGQVADAVRLFADRAQLVDPAFQLTTDTEAMVSRIVARLDGLPLAIELAAARCESLGLIGLLHQLDQPLAVLTSGPRGAPARQRSLRATIEWSYQLLSPSQQQVLRRLGVFPGPFTLEAAEAVAGRQVLDLVPRLVDCSLLTPPTISGDGRPRYLMLETVASFAREQLAVEEPEQEVRASTAAYALSVAERASAGIAAAGREVAAVTWCDLEAPLLRQSLSWALAHDPPVARRIALALAPWFQLRGRAPTGYPLLQDALTRTDRDDVWFAAQVWLGRLAHSIADWPAALHHFDTVCEALGSSPPTTRMVDALTGRSGTRRNQSDLTQATTDAETALRLARQLDYPEGQAQALVQLSLAASYSGDQQAATRWADQAARVDPAGLPDRVSRRVAIATTISQADAGRLDQAGRACAEGLALARRAGDVDMEADFLYFTTHIALQAGDFDHAGPPIRESLRLSMRSGDRLRLLDCLDDCARLCAATGRPAEALTLWAARRSLGEAALMPELTQAAHLRDTRLREVRALLGPKAAEAAEQRGDRMSLGAAAELASLTAAAGATHIDPAASAGLTPRERELLTLLAGGRTDAQIAAELFISIRTVRSHLDRIRDKTGSRRRADLTRLALQIGLV
jgi:predicted ATPase/DNA-binding CsgD family transcriptional regulator